MPLFDRFRIPASPTSYALEPVPVTSVAEEVSRSLSSMIGDAPVVHPADILPVSTVRITGVYDGVERHVELPVYDPDAMWPDAKLHIPKIDDLFYVDNDNVLHRIAVALRRRVAPMLWGEPGSGKTEAARYLAALTRKPFIDQQFEESSEIYQMIGKQDLRAGETVWVWGRMAQWLTHPALWLGDEYNGAPDMIRFYVRAALDSRGWLAIDAKDGQKLMRHRGFDMILTGNPHWNMRNTGVLPLAEADADRMAHIYVHYPPAAAELAILQRLNTAESLGLSQADLVCIVHSWRVLRDLASRGEHRMAVGVRSMMNFTRFYADLPTKAALEMVFGRDDIDEYQPILDSAEITGLGADVDVTTLAVWPQLTDEQRQAVLAERDQQPINNEEQR